MGVLDEADEIANNTTEPEPCPFCGEVHDEEPTQASLLDALDALADGITNMLDDERVAKLFVFANSNRDYVGIVAGTREHAERWLRVMLSPVALEQSEWKLIGVHPREAA